MTDTATPLTTEAALNALPARPAQAMPTQNRPGLANLCFVRFLHGSNFCPLEPHNATQQI